MNDYPISDELLQSHHLAILATTGAGKSYLTRGLAERMRRAGWRNGIIDKLGNYWGLTIGEDGESKGLEYVIFGGRRFHVEMQPTDGAKIAELFIKQDIPAIFDLSLWKPMDQQIWVRDFCDALFLLNDQPLHLIMDEIQSWAPQSGGSICSDSIQRLATQGRGTGIKLVMAAQRPATVDKTVLYMATAVVAMRMVGRIDRKSIGDMFEPYVKDVREITDALPGLPTGTGFLWDPVNGRYDRITFPKNTTYDSSATPKFGDRTVAAPVINKSLVKKLQEFLAVEKVKKAIDEAPAGTVVVDDRSQEIIQTLQNQLAETSALAQKQSAYVQFTEKLLRSISEAVQIPFEQLSSPWPDLGKEVAEHPVVEHFAKPTPEKAAYVESTLAAPGPEEELAGVRRQVSRMIYAVRDLHPRRAVIADVCRIANVSMKSSAFPVNLRQFKEHDWIEQTDGLFGLSATGLAANPKCGAVAIDLITAWKNVLSPAEGRVFDAFCVRPFGTVLTKEQIAENANISLTSSALGGSISALRTQGLLEKAHHGWRLTRPFGGNDAAH